MNDAPRISLGCSTDYHEQCVGCDCACHHVTLTDQETTMPAKTTHEPTPDTTPAPPKRKRRTKAELAQANGGGDPVAAFKAAREAMVAERTGIRARLALLDEALGEEAPS